MNRNSRLTRRSFLSGSLIGGSAVAMGTIPVRLLAQDKVSEDDPAAAALGYVHDANDVDLEKFPKRGGDGANQFCDNCALFAGAEGEEWAPCSIFQNRLVAGKGWCNAWVAKV